MVTSPLPGGAVRFCGTESTDSSGFPLTELTWVSRTVLSRVLASEALADQNELEARICWALPRRLTTKHIFITFLKVRKVRVKPLNLPTDICLRI